MSRWKQVMVITKEQSTIVAYDALCAHDEYHEETPEIVYITEEFNKLWDEGPVKAFKFNEDSYYSVAFSKTSYSYPPFDYDTLHRAFPIVETSGSKAYDQCSAKGLSGKYLCLVEEYGNFDTDKPRVGFEDDEAFIEQETHPARFAWCNWAACDAYVTPEDSRVPATEAPCVPIDEIVYPDYAGYDIKQVEQVFEGYLQYFKDIKHPSMTFADWNLFGAMLVETKNTCTAVGFARSICLPTAAIVTPDGVWHDASTDYDNNESAWAANYYDDIVKPYASNCYATRFLAEDW